MSGFNTRSQYRNVCREGFFDVVTQEVASPSEKLPFKHLAVAKLADHLFQLGKPSSECVHALLCSGYISSFVISSCVLTVHKQLCALLCSQSISSCVISSCVLKINKQLQPVITLI